MAITEISINGLPLPQRLAALINSGQWRDLDQKRLLGLIPWLQGRIQLINSADWMERESGGKLASLPGDVFLEARGSLRKERIELPWIDVEQSVLIGVNEVAGDDLGIALDYRTGLLSPRIIATYWQDAPNRCIWRLAAASFDEFADILGK